MPPDPVNRPPPPARFRAGKAQAGQTPCNRARAPYVRALCLALGALAAPVGAQDLAFPFPVAEVTAEPAAVDSYALPVAGWSAGTLPVRRVEGMVDRRAWRLDAAGVPLLAILAPLRDQLVAQGYQVLLDCETRACGGFDFRFATEVLPEPGMHVDLGDFRFLSAVRGVSAISLMVSRSARSAFVQVISVGPDALPPPVFTSGTAPAGVAVVDPVIVAPAAGPAPEAIGARLAAGLPVALDDLVFASGAAALEDSDFASLAALADWLHEDAARSVILVGHTDASGGLKANIDLSTRRAEAVRQMLVARFGVDGRQVSAQGVGPLAPRDSNLTEEGRHKNRRVEAIPAPT